MSNIDKRALREAAEKASTDNHTQDEWFHYLRCSTPETVLALLDELEAAEKRIADGENRIRKQNRHVCELFDDNTALRQRIIELEEKLQTADKLQDSAFRHGLQHGFSLGQTDNQAGFEECLSSYGTGKGE
ncbi:ead/Ea22-like family protein [Enterobacter hormaechei]|uniref:ead/Ea22-like family protein n=1 Tax=Enterobacter hormaechei TaxID=158836 RepID=UPI0018C2A9B9|nr:ead/Ea22-like family protein [Enterobacter hormaechei]MBG0534011.1 ead/Ea22-like family protein [Enterobacter hormaechei]